MSSASSTSSVRRRPAIAQPVPAKAGDSAAEHVEHDSQVQESGQGRHVEPAPVETGGGLDFGMVDTSSPKGQASTTSGQLHTRLPRYYGPLRHPERPGLSLAGRRSVRAMPPPGFPVLHPSPLHACRRHYPGGTGRCVRRSLPDRYQPSPSYRRIGFRIINFEACSAFTRVATRMAAESPVATRSVGVLQSMSLPSSTAPTATGWSDGCRAEFASADEWRLGTAYCNFLYWLEGIGGRA